MLGYHTVLHAKHVKPEGLVMLAVTACPRLAHINDNDVVVADHIQQFALVVGREFLSETLAERVHETLQPSRHLRIVLKVVRPQKPRRRLDIAADQYRRVKIPDHSFIARRQCLVGPSWLRRNGYRKYENEYSDEPSHNSDRHIRLHLF